MFVLKTGKGDYVSIVDLDDNNLVQVLASPDVEHALLYTNLTIASMSLVGFTKMGCEITIEEVEV